MTISIIKMRIISFNVNGIKSIHNKSKTGEKGCSIENNVLNMLVKEQNPDILCLQEIRCQDLKLLETYKTYFPHIYASHSTVKKGYSGTAILSKEKPIKVTNYIHDTASIHNEGRIIVAEYEKYYVVNVYTPNSKDELARLNERLEWDTMFKNYVKSLNKPVITCGDFNCANEDIDIHNPKVHHKSAGFSDDERKSFHSLLEETSLIDTFRFMNPTSVKYSYWSNFHQSRSKNRGWRIDYVLSSKGLTVNFADILSDYFGSDHCPVVADIVT